MSGKDGTFIRFTYITILLTYHQFSPLATNPAFVHQLPGIEGNQGVVPKFFHQE